MTMTYVYLDWADTDRASSRGLQLAAEHARQGYEHDQQRQQHEGGGLPI